MKQVHILTGVYVNKYMYVHTKQYIFVQYTIMICTVIFLINTLE